MDRDDFVRIATELSQGSFTAQDAELVFCHIVKSGKMTFDNFDRNFKSVAPTGLDMETKIIRTVREWMFLKNLSAEGAFDTLCRSTQKYQDKQLDK